MSGSFDLQSVAADLERLALKTVMLAEDDVPALGAFLNELEALQEKLAAGQVPEGVSLLRQMGEVANRLTLSEIAAAAQALELLELGVRLLQQWAKHGGWPEAGEEWRAYRRILAELGITASASESGAAAAVADGDFCIDDPELLANFLAEAHEHLEGIETRLVHWEQNPGELEAINAIFRPFHTIKGVAGFLNLEQIQALSHEVESLLDEVRSGRLAVSTDLVDAVLAGVDLLRDLLEDVRGAMGEAQTLPVRDLAPLKERLQTLRPDPAGRPRLGEILVDQGVLNPEDLDASLAAQKALKVHQPLGELLVQEGKAPPRAVAQALVQQMSAAKTGEDAAAPATVKVDLAKVDLLVDLMGELVIIQSQVRQNQKI
jgi:two-component system, chemotaxis family, sensor kinase CheA